MESPSSNDFASIKNKWKVSAHKHGSPLPGRIRPKKRLDNGGKSSDDDDSGEVTHSNSLARRRHSLAVRPVANKDDLDKLANVDLVDQKVSPSQSRRNNSFRESSSYHSSPVRGESIRQMLKRFDASFRENGDGAEQNKEVSDLVILEDSHEGSCSMNLDYSSDVLLHSPQSAKRNGELSKTRIREARVAQPKKSPVSPFSRRDSPKKSPGGTIPNVPKLSPKAAKETKTKNWTSPRKSPASSNRKKKVTPSRQSGAGDDSVSALDSASENGESCKTIRSITNNEPSTSSVSSRTDADLLKTTEADSASSFSGLRSAPSSPIRKPDLLRSTDHERSSTFSGGKKNKKDELRASDHPRLSKSPNKTKEERKSRSISPKKKKKKDKAASGSKTADQKPAANPETVTSRPRPAARVPAKNNSICYRRKRPCIYQQTGAGNKADVPRYEHSEADQDRILQALYNNESLTSCRAGHLSQLVSAFERCQYPAGEILMEEGDSADYMFVVDSGLLEITANEKHLTTAAAGDSFGELSLLYDTRRSTTVLALEDCKMFRLHVDSFKAILAADSRRCLQKRRRLLQGIKFFEYLSSIEVREISEIMTPRLFSPGSAILTKDDVSDSFFVVADGQVQQGSGKSVILRSGDYFGEESMVTGKPVACDYRALSESLVFVFEKRKFTVDLASSILMVQDAQVLSRVACLSEYEPKYLLTLLKEKTFPYGENLYLEKESSKACLYIVRSGHLSLRSGGVKDMLGPGAVFGEAVVQRALAKSKKSAKATYSVTATEKCSCAVLSAKDIIDGPKVEFEAAFPTSKPIAVPDKLSALEKHSILGQGAFGQVWLVSDKSRENSFALKIQSKSFLVEENQVEAVIQEKVMLANLKHPFLINLHRTYQDKKSIYFLMDYVQGGELFTLLHNNEEGTSLPEDHAKFYALSLADVLRYLHRGKYVYRGEYTGDSSNGFLTKLLTKLLRS